MGSIVCRHREHTIFDRLSDNYNNRSNFFYFEGAGDNKEAMSLSLDPKSFSARLERDNDGIKMKWFKAKKKGLESPDKVLKDVHINDSVFISLCGYICSTNDYEATGELYDVTEILNDIQCNQPQPGYEFFELSNQIKNKILKFDQIPSIVIFSSFLAKVWDFGYTYKRCTKYNKESINRRTNDEYYLRGELCPFVEEGYYENINLYEDDVIWYNPTKKYVQINHAVTKNNFFDTDGYLCGTWNYKYVNKQEIDFYYKKFLFLI